MRWRATLLLGEPVAIVAGAMVHVRIDHGRARAGLVSPDPIEWRASGAPLRIDVRRRLEGEIERFEIDIVAAADGDSLHRTTFATDHDLFGGGFVGGLDLDGDGVPSLVLAMRHAPDVGIADTW